MYGFGGSWKWRLIIGAIMVLFYYFSYLSKKETNELTGESQHVSLTPEQEVALGLESAPQMAEEYGGLYQNQEVQDQVSAIGNRLVTAFNENLAKKGIKDPYQFNFYVLADPNTINAFALPGGQVFITLGLLSKLSSEDEVAGVLGHEIGHVIHRHSSQQMAKSDFYQGLAGAATAASGSYETSQLASYVAQMKLMKFSRGDELQSDSFGVQIMMMAGYNPNSLIKVMEILGQSSGGMSRSEFMSSHPSPDNRIQIIQEEIAKNQGKY